MRNWSDVANFTATSLNDFKMILGMNFLIATKAVSMPHLGFIGFVEEGSSCMVRVVRGEPSKGKAISAIQLKKGSKKETTYLAVLEMKEDFEEEGLPYETRVLQRAIPRSHFRGGKWTVLPSLA